MTDIMDGSTLIGLVAEKHRKFLETYGSEFSELEAKFNMLKEQSDAAKKEMDSTESRITVLTEKYHLLFYQAKKQKDETLNTLIDKMRKAGYAGLNDVSRLGGRIEEFEKRLQNSKHIEDEDKSITEIKKLLYELETAGRKAGVQVSFRGVMEKMNEASASHRELLSIQDRPKQNSESFREFEKQRSEMEGRYNWLKHRIESHNNALAYWEKQKGGVPA